MSAGASANATDDNDNDHRFNVVPSNHTHESSAGHMNMRGVFLHLLADALGSVIVIVSALVCYMIFLVSEKSFFFHLFRIVYLIFFYLIRT